ncbi:CapA family protein [Glutamicibacter sp. 287]|uniref:CapA family protein n=1 Tax=unclassified Glutamicibacter TaxID=2627139 RepID=UPI000BB87822|nr:CapA family protein [Glutamicibacter sp. BW80]PCC29173.1 metallophosphatase [Glutamicibacter sp. BW80]
MKQRALPVFLAFLLLTSCSANTSGEPTPTANAPQSKPAPVPSTPSPPPEPQELSLMATGDVLLHPQLLAEAETGDGHDFAPLLAGLEPYVQDADVALCNLETPIGTAPYSGYPMFSVPAQIVTDLAKLGYDGCTTATNHTVDKGTAGVNRTLDTLEQQDLFATGSYRTAKEAAEPPIMTVDGVKFGIIASTYSLNGMRADADWQVDTGVGAAKLIQRAKQAAKDGAEIVVAAIHDGAEYSSKPTEAQRRLGRALAESGAFDFIYMHHTHSVLPIEKHAGTWIVYGLGNSVAKHATPTILNREGISIKATFTRDPKEDWGLSELAWVPHQLSESPVRWCQVATADDCLPAADAKASLARTTQTVNAFDAFDDGLVPWEVD